MLGPPRTKRCWAGPLSQQSLPGRPQPGRELNRARRRSHDGGPHRGGCTGAPRLSSTHLCRSCTGAPRFSSLHFCSLPRFDACSRSADLWFLNSRVAGSVRIKMESSSATPLDSELRSCVLGECLWILVLASQFGWLFL